MRSLCKLSEGGTRFENAKLIGLTADDWQFNNILWTMWLVFAARLDWLTSAWGMLRLWLEIDRYIGLPIFFPIFKHFAIIGFVKKIYIYIFFFTYIIIQSITSSEILFSAFDPSKYTHTWSSVHSGNAPAQPPHVTLYKINLFETRWIILTFTIEPLFRQ